MNEVARDSIRSFISTDTAQTDDTIMSSTTSLKSVVEGTFSGVEAAAVIKLLMSIDGASWETVAMVLNVIKADANACKKLVIIAPGGAYSITRKATDVFPQIAGVISSLPGFKDQSISSRDKISDNVNLALFRMASSAVTAAMAQNSKVPDSLKAAALKSIQKQSTQVAQGSDEARKAAQEAMMKNGMMTQDAADAAADVVKKAFP